MKKNSKIYIAGHRGMVGSGILRLLDASGYTNLVFKTRRELDLMDQSAVNLFFETERPEYVFLAAARVGGILANSTYPAQFIHENLVIQTNVIHAAHQYGVLGLLFLGSSCIYPKLCPQPIREEYLLTSPLEPTNEAYAVAKITGVKMCEFYNRQYGTNFWPVMPTNLYGPHDNFDLETSHLLPALIRKFHEAKEDGHREVTLWGSGTPRREFLHVDDLAGACLHIMNLDHGKPCLVNIGCGEDLTILELAERVQTIIGHKGNVIWDRSKPDGTPRKWLDISLIESMGWHPTIRLEDGIRQVYDWYLATSESSK